jgi:uncharacterized protein YndB with AHSA1/START domain
MEQRVVELQAEIDADAETVWRVLTTPALMREYFLGAEVKSDWQVGRPISFSGEWKGEAFRDRGEILEFAPPRELSYSHWSAKGGRAERPDGYHLVRFRLEPRGERTHLLFEQSNAGDAPMPDARTREEFKRTWAHMIEGLKQVAEREALVGHR